MGENLAMNILNHGFRLAVYNRTVEKTTRFAEGRAQGMNVIPVYSLEELVAALRPPRCVMMLIRAGNAVDDMIEQLIPLMENGDIIIDGGNSNFRDTIRRTQYVESKGLCYVGCGVSGGEEGALRGPSLMPGESKEAWPFIKSILQAVAAKVEDMTCCDWVGENGAGHFVKMVHNGIEYGDMQIICETYHIMRALLRMLPAEISAVFETWNKGVLDSYLIEITAQILKKTDADGEPQVDNILDTAGQKGTGKWTGIEALNEGIPLTMIGEAVFARYLSAMKEVRVSTSRVLRGPAPGFTGDKVVFLNALEKALYAAKIISYAQGYMLMRAAAGTYNWNLNYGGIAMTWCGGCIIRSVLLGHIRDAFVRNPLLGNLLLDPYFFKSMNDCEQSLRTVCAQAVLNGVPTPEFSAALSFYDGYRCARLPANLLQAQRDFFDAHTYERVDAPRGEFFHTSCRGESSSTTTFTYTA